MTPKEYINRLRINTACHRIKHSHKSMKAIAYDCGFDSYEHFIKVFKKMVGTTPTEYRKTNSV
ncbi:MAG: helix-turn-helix domain-containing protein [Lachnospiraceae bacterium]|nr:helix-turn-helix domain-containing protein [Lachnospiraceae bacterium]